MVFSLNFTSILVNLIDRIVQFCITKNAFNLITDLILSVPLWIHSFPFDLWKEYDEQVFTKRQIMVLCCGYALIRDLIRTAKTSVRKVSNGCEPDKNYVKSRKVYLFLRPYFIQSNIVQFMSALLIHVIISVISSVLNFWLDRPLSKIFITYCSIKMAKVPNVIRFFCLYNTDFTWHFWFHQESQRDIAIFNRSVVV